MMNKKKYIKPDMQVVKMEQHGFLCYSGGGTESGAPELFFDDIEY